MERVQLAGRIKDAITVLNQEGSKPGMPVPSRAGCRNSEIFSTIALNSGVVTALSNAAAIFFAGLRHGIHRDGVLRGPFPARKTLIQFRPAITPAGDALFT